MNQHIYKSSDFGVVECWCGLHSPDGTVEFAKEMWVSDCIKCLENFINYCLKNEKFYNPQVFDQYIRLIEVKSFNDDVNKLIS